MRASRLPWLLAGLALCLWACGGRNSLRPTITHDGGAGGAGTSGGAAGATAGTGSGGAAGSSGIAGTSGAAGAAPQPDAGVERRMPRPGAKVDGAKCASPDDCVSGFCEQGVCCATACTQACASCAVPGQVGLCTRASGGTYCGPGRPGVDPAATGCLNEYELTRDECNAGIGDCRGVVVALCWPYKCLRTASTCEDSCASDADCVLPTHCLGGRCGGLKFTTCASNAECASGFCTDGVCCNAPCGPGPCMSCNLPGREGVCMAIEKGVADPRGLCKDLGPSTCGHNGLCDGFYGCAFYPAHTACAEATCATGMDLSICDGRGKCVAPTAKSCAP